MPGHDILLLNCKKLNQSNHSKHMINRVIQCREVFHDMFLAVDVNNNLNDHQSLC